jgi:hypothetical protein
VRFDVSGYFYYFPPVTGIFRNTQASTMKNLFSPFWRMFSSGTLFVDNSGGPGAGAPPATPPSNPPTFTQADVDRIVADRIAAATAQYQGIDPKEFKRLSDAEAERQRKEGEAKGEYTRILAEQKTQFDTETAKLRTQLADERIKNAIEGEASKQNAISPKQVRELLSGKVRVNDAGSIEVLDAEGKPAYKAGIAVSITDLVEVFLKDNTHFVAAGPSGSGATGSGIGGTSKTIKRSAFFVLSPAERSELIGKGFSIIE